MIREIRPTADGSHTIAIPEKNLTYHSHHGAIAESMHVFIEAGLIPLLNTPSQQLITILEIGFGTGLNALLAMQQAINYKKPLHYITIETDPLTEQEVATINHGHLLSLQEMFLQLHATHWEADISLNDFFTIHKKKISLLDLDLDTPVNCIFFDAFAPTDQPELWTQPVFEKLYKLLIPNGTLVTYSSKSVIRKAMHAAGFNVTKIPGPHGKRDMVRAIKQTVNNGCQM
jgi:tRNA U34 5-methylaminomethyl-2-thiouridine-forming methyltransferase MnmC